MIPTGRHLWTPRLWIEVREAWRLVWAVLAYVHVSLTGDPIVGVQRIVSGKTRTC